MMRGLLAARRACRVDEAEQDGRRDGSQQQDMTTSEPKFVWKLPFSLSASSRAIVALVLLPSKMTPLQLPPTDPADGPCSHANLYPKAEAANRDKIPCLLCHVDHIISHGQKNLYVPKLASRRSCLTLAVRIVGSSHSLVNLLRLCLILCNKPINFATSSFDYQL